MAALPKLSTLSCTLLLLFSYAAFLPTIVLAGEQQAETATQPLDYSQIYQQAMQGDIDAQLRLFTAYRLGNGVERNIHKALMWLTSAGDSGDAESQYWLGHIYFFGDGVQRDVEDGMAWLKKSATHDFIPAQVMLGQIYNGWRYRFYPSNKLAAIYWYTMAAMQGHLQSIYIVGCRDYFSDGTDSEQQRGLSWFRKAAELGDDTAIAYLRLDNSAELRLFCNSVERL